MTGFRTVRKEVSVTFTEKKSRFIANVKPVKSEEEAISHINFMKNKFHDARHNVYAYCIKTFDLSNLESGNILGNISERYSDDGEPQGTAGLPVLEVIKKNSLINLCIVVTRYFGGILLGAPGLVRAYGKSTALGLESAGICEMLFCRTVCVKIDYSLISQVQRAIEGANISLKQFFIDRIEYGESACVFVNVLRGFDVDFERFITEITNARYELVPIANTLVVSPW